MNAPGMYPQLRQIELVRSSIIWLAPLNLPARGDVLNLWIFNNRVGLLSWVDAITYCCPTARIEHQVRR